MDSHRHVHAHIHTCTHTRTRTEGHPWGPVGPSPSHKNSHIQHSQGLIKHLGGPSEGSPAAGQGPRVPRERPTSPSPGARKATQEPPASAGTGGPGWRGHSHLARPQRGCRARPLSAWRPLPPQAPAASTPASASHANEAPPPRSSCTPPVPGRGQGARRGRGHRYPAGPAQTDWGSDSTSARTRGQGPLCEARLGPWSAPQAARARLDGCPELGEGGAPDPGPLLTVPPCPPPPPRAHTCSAQVHFNPLDPVGGPHGLGGVQASGPRDGARLRRPRLEVPVFQAGPRGALRVTHGKGKRTRSWPGPRLGSSGFTPWLPAPEAGAGDRQAGPQGRPGLHREGCRGGPGRWAWEGPVRGALLKLAHPYLAPCTWAREDPTVRPVSLATWTAARGPQGRPARLP